MGRLFELPVAGGQTGKNPDVFHAHSGDRFANAWTWIDWFKKQFCKVFRSL